MHFSDDDLKTIRVWSEKYERSPLNKDSFDWGRIEEEE